MPRSHVQQHITWLIDEIKQLNEQIRQTI